MDDVKTGDEIDTEDYCTTVEAAFLIGWHPETLRRLVRENKCPISHVEATGFRAKKAYLFPREEVEDFASRRMKEKAENTIKRYVGERGLETLKQSLRDE